MQGSILSVSIVIQSAAMTIDKLAITSFYFSYHCNFQRTKRNIKYFQINNQQISLGKISLGIGGTVGLHSQHFLPHYGLRISSVHYSLMDQSVQRASDQSVTLGLVSEMLISTGTWKAMEGESAHLPCVLTR